jgi:hypothetical protein
MPPVAGWLAAVFERERGVTGERGELGSGTSSGAISIDEGIFDTPSRCSRLGGQRLVVMDILLRRGVSTR